MANHHGAESLLPDPFMMIMDALPAHVRVRPRLLGPRTLVLFAVGVALFGVAWWLAIN